MGGGGFTSHDWATYSTKKVAGKSAREIYKEVKMDPDFDPKNIVIRESRDSEEHPRSTAIILAEDVTGSMSHVLEATMKGLGVLVLDLLDTKPVTDPQIMAMAIGDVEVGDAAPLQVSQFESDIRIAEQLSKLYLEGGGGGNSYESYALAWYFAATRTSTDCFEKRGIKGYLFTIGDELPTPYLKAGDLEKVFGPGQLKDLSMEELYQMACQKYEVFHILVREGSNYSEKVEKAWKHLMGQNLIPLDDHKKLAEVVAAVIKAREGFNREDIMSTLSEDTTKSTVSTAIATVSKKSDITSGENAAVLF